MEEPKIEPKSEPKIECTIDNNILIYSCPHCNCHITTAIQELACRIFRHGFCMANNQQIPPHESKERCDLLAKDPMIVGCCKPFKIISEQDSGTIKYYCIVCDYI